MARAVLLLTLLPLAAGLHFLAVLPYQGKSHQIIFHGVMRALLARGHSITNVSPVVLEGNFSQYQHVLTPFPKWQWADIFEYEEQINRGAYQMRRDLEQLSDIFMEAFFSSEEVQALVSHSDAQFDAVLLEPFFGQEQLVFLGRRFGAPVVSLATTEPTNLEDEFSGSPRDPGVVPEWGTSAPRAMSWPQRAANTVAWAWALLDHRLVFLPRKERSIGRFSFPGRDLLPPLEDMLRDIDLFLANSSPIAFLPRPVAPHVKYVPGLHINPAPPIPSDIKSLMDRAAHGVILFSFGSLTPISKLPEQRKRAFIEAFRRMPNLIFWKSDVDIPGVPENVKVSSWLPQQAILAHKNCRLLMTHGGMLSKQEALYFGVPMVVIPLFGDQPMNAGLTQRLGVGLALQFGNISQESVSWAVHSVLTDPSFSTEASRVSKVFREEVKQSPDQVNYWIEYTIKNKNSNYLKPTTTCFITRHFIDFVIIFVIISQLILYYIYKIFMLYCKRKGGKDKKLKAH